MHPSGRSYHSGSLTFIFFILMAIGLANLYSAGAEDLYFQTQLRHTAIGVLAFIIFGWLIPVRHINTYAYLFFALIVLSLAFVLILGHTAGGAQRWIRLGPFRFQPSEIAKLSVAIVVAKFFYHNRSIGAYRLKELWPLLLMAVGTFILIFKQPDFGTAGICLLIVTFQLAFIRIQANFKTVLGIGLAGLSTGVIGWNFLLHPYQKLRILNLLNPNMDPSGSGYNSLQSLVAIGSGKHFGKGFLQGTQTQLQFLPARHTDFIFSVFAEEHGFWGCSVIFILFTALAYIALDIARESRDCFNALLAVGVAAIIFIEFTLNVAMVLGMFPVVGMPLPFFSYGGSALLTVCIAVGILIAIDRENASGNRSSRGTSVQNERSRPLWKGSSI